MNKKKFSDYIKAFEFRKLFIDLGWDNYASEIPLSVDDKVFILSGIVEKRGFVIFLCPPDDNGKIPPHTSRKKIENQFSRLHQEHLIIYEDRDKTRQIWQYVIHERDKPKRVHEIPYNTNQDPEILYQRARGMLFTLDEEENITLVDVIARFKEGFGKNTEQVTKKFYDEFKKHHTSFLDFIEGIDDAIKIQDNLSATPTAQADKNKQWYASLMLSRLMFCYFIQKRGYLDNDLNYLQNKLKEVKEQEGENRFYGFYRDFLLRLFHHGLGQPEKTRNLTRSLTVDLGNIPYLDGGLFDVHVLERQFEEIKIRDDAFERIFNFFDQWNWHLDTGVEATGRDINPDVIGYIFEKYINDRAAMGAYYTREDITDYIGKNTIIPFLFDTVKKKYPKAFKCDGWLWTFLRESGDTYIYDAVKKGISEAANGNNPQKIEDLNIPRNIAIGLDTQRPELPERRMEWNTKTPAEYALPTEIWRETIARWKRYFEVRDKITGGEITGINDFITCNLNIRQFTQDTLENTDDPGLIRHFYKAIHSITILDPTCGSGAFLFAALNILEPLYETCIERMEQFTAEATRKYKFFDDVLAEINSEEHPNLKYYIYKTIILNNLYGVDIMHEAVEIAKLRLFLKIVGAADMNLRKPNFGLEPLPDIDFNIRAGNTLVGFATEKELKNAILYDEYGNMRLDFGSKLDKFKEECQIVATAFRRFQDAQLITDKGEDTHKKAKAELQNRLDVLNEKLNAYLASTYGIDKNKIPDEKKFKKKYEEWLSSHQPFHWFAEFYEIINGSGGFDVVIGNPPYVEYSKVKKKYNVLNLNTLSCGNIYAYIIEKTYSLLNQTGFSGMIVPLSFSSSKRMIPLQKLHYEGRKSWVSNYEGGTNPSVMFNGVKQNLCIVISCFSNKKIMYTTKLYRFFSEERASLFSLIIYVSITNKFIEYGIPKISTDTEFKILSKLFQKKPLMYQMSTSKTNTLYIHRIASYYIKCFNFVPFFKNERDGLKKSEDYKEYSFNRNAEEFLGVINSSLFYLYWQIFYDTFKAGKYAIEHFPYESNFNDVEYNNLS